MALTDQDNSANFQTEEDELRAIWVTLGVGENGYLTMPELAKVCYHIGLDEMNNDVSMHNHQHFHHQFFKV